MRIGVNGGSAEKELLRKYGGPKPEALVESALKHVRMLEKQSYYDMVISIKSSNVPNTIEAYRLMSRECDYPLHIGVTEAGGGEMALVKAAAAMGALLVDGIGDTMRVSMTGDPVQEVYAAKEILKAMGLRKEGVEIVSCPTCGRTCTDLLSAANRVEHELSSLIPKGKYLKVAVMGCIVNGPGEAAEADIGVAFGKGGCALFKGGKLFRTVPLETAVDELITEAKAMME